MRENSEKTRINLKKKSSKQTPVADVWYRGLARSSDAALKLSASCTIDADHPFHVICSPWDDVTGFRLMAITYDVRSSWQQVRQQLEGWGPPGRLLLGVPRAKPRSGPVALKHGHPAMHFLHALIGLPSLMHCADSSVHHEWTLRVLMLLKTLLRNNWQLALTVFFRRDSSGRLHYNTSAVIWKRSSKCSMS